MNLLENLFPENSGPITNCSVVSFATFFLLLVKKLSVTWPFILSIIYSISNIAVFPPPYTLITVNLKSYFSMLLLGFFLLLVLNSIYGFSHRYCLNSNIRKFFFSFILSINQNFKFLQIKIFKCTMTSVIYRLSFIHALWFHSLKYCVCFSNLSSIIW